MKILLIGGHLTPALAFADYLLTQKDVEVAFVGRRFSQTQNKQKALEESLVTQKGIPFFALAVPKFQSWYPWDILFYCWQYLRALFISTLILFKQKPDVVVSFGGYMAIPVTITAKLFRAKIITHEQTITAGRANKIIARFADKIAISFPQSKEYFPKGKVILTGNPIRPLLLSSKPQKPDWFTSTSKKPLLYITGGNQGSHLLNNVVKQSLRQLTRNFLVIHTCGRATSKFNYLKDLEKAQKKLPSTHQHRYLVREWVDEADLAWILDNAQLAVSRSGANTIQELIIKKVPAILVPLPFSFNQEQQLNAKFMAESGGAVVVPQNTFTPEALITNLKQMAQTKKALSRKLGKIELPIDGAKQLYQVVQNVLA